VARHLENWLQAYLEYTRHLEAPDTFHFWAGIATIAGALRGKVWIDMGYWKWKPNFFIIYVGPPGIVAKSTTIGVGMELLREVEGIHFGPDSATWQAITSAFAESTEVVTFSDNSTTEMSAITISASELGTFLDPRNREMIDVLVDLWDGRPVPWRRSTRGEGESNIPNPWLNFVGATTPSWIAENFPEYAIGGGFTSRTVFIYGEHKRHFTAYPQLKMLTTDSTLKESLINDLKIIAQFKGAFKILPETFRWGEAWYKDHWKNGVPNVSQDRLQGYLARKQTHIHKVAMIISVSKRNDLTITPEDLATADTLVTALEGDMNRVFEKVSDNYQTKYLTAIVTVLRTVHKSIPKKVLWQRLLHLMPWTEYESALQGLINAGYVKQMQSGNDMMIIPSLPDTAAPSRDIGSAIASQLDDLPQSHSSDNDAVSGSS